MLESEIPSHSHAVSMSLRPADNLNPVGLALGTGNAIYATPANLVSMASQTLSPAGGNQPHNNLQPYLTFYFCIASGGVSAERVGRRSATIKITTRYLPFL